MAQAPHVNARIYFFCTQTRSRPLPCITTVYNIPALLVICGHIGADLSPLFFGRLAFILTGYDTSCPPFISFGPAVEPQIRHHVKADPGSRFLQVLPRALLLNVSASSPNRARDIAALTVSLDKRLQLENNFHRLAASLYCVEVWRVVTAVARTLGNSGCRFSSHTRCCLVCPRQQQQWVRGAETEDTR